MTDIARPLSHILSYRSAFTKLLSHPLRTSSHCVFCMKASSKSYVSGKTLTPQKARTVVRIPLNNKYALRVISSNSGSSSDQSSEGQPEVTVKPVKKRTDYQQKFHSNVFITPWRAMREYLLTPAELSTLWNATRRSPYENSPPITVYLREEVEKRAKEKFGSLENLEREKSKARRHEELYLRGLTSSRPVMFDYKEKYSYEPKSDQLLEKQRKTIFKSGSGKVVLTAILVNSVNAVVKCVAWLYTGSHAMFAEAIHSLADTLNQCILAYGIHHSLKNPDPNHPYGYTNFRYVSSLISGVGIFCVGAGFAWYHGIAGIVTKTQLVDMSWLPMIKIEPTTTETVWAIMLLGASFLSESFTLGMAIQNIRRKARQAGETPVNYVLRGTDPSVNVVLMEDLAAVCGVAVAGTCMYISFITSNHIPDAVGSIIIGSLLASVSLFIIKTNSNALLGRSIPEVSKRELMAALESDMMIRSVHDIKATDMGSNLIRFKAEVDIDGKLLTNKYLDGVDLNGLLSEMQALETSKDAELFLLYHGERIVDLIGGEIDRIEGILKKTNPQVRHVDLEIL